MSQRIMKRWKSKFARFVDVYGARPLANDLCIDQSAIYFWVKGRTAPRPHHAATIQRLARERGIRLTFEEIYRAYLEKLASEEKEGASRVAMRATATPLSHGNVVPVRVLS
jgi:hypothetical protein